MFKLDLEKVEEPESICQYPLNHKKKQRNSKKKIYFCFTDYSRAFDCVDHNKQWKILKEMGIPDYLACLLRYLYAGQPSSLDQHHTPYIYGRANRYIYLLPI